MNCNNCEDIYPQSDMTRWESCPSSIIADADNYYTKHQVDELIESASGCCITPEEVDEKISEAVSGKADTSYVDDELAKKLDASAYTPTDLSNYYTKSETSGKTELSTALNNKQDKLIAGANITISGNVISAAGGSEPIIIDPTLSSGSSNPVANSAITEALNDKLDVTAYTPTDLTNYYTKTESDGRYQPKGSYLTSGDTYLKGEIDDKLARKLDVTAYTPTDLSNYYTKSEVDNFISGLQNQISALTEALNECCSGTPITIEYRWVTVSGQYTCSGYDKYTKEQKQQSTDGGTTWTNVSPAEYRQGSTLIETNSVDCGYTPPSYKLTGTLVNNQQVTVACNQSSTLTSGETATTSKYKSIEIGSCIDTIGENAFLTEWVSAITIPSNIKTLEKGAFSSCVSATSLTLNEGLETIGQAAFTYCSSIGSVVIPNSVKTIGVQAFYVCNSLSSVTIGSGVTTISRDAFAQDSVGGHNNMQSVTILATTPPTIAETAQGSAYTTTVFNGSYPIYVPAQSVTTYQTAVGWSGYASRIQAIPFTGKWLATYTGGTTSSAACDSSGVIAQNEITNKANLESVVIGDCVTSLDNATFYDCAYLTSIIIPSGVTSIGFRCFQNCSSLTSVTVEATTPPTLSQSYPFDGTNDCPIYVPAESVNAYKAASGWSQYSSRIQAIP